MKAKILISIFLTILTLLSCSSGNDSSVKTNLTSDSIQVLKEVFPQGEIIDKVVCKNDASQNYSLYLPKNYTPTKTYPILFIFDPHGDGKLPITLYKDLAEKYSYILAGSNNSKNGNSWDDSKYIAEKLFADVQGKVSVNAQRVYVLGFSGGARIANGLTITNGYIAGAICCGASAPAASSAKPRTNYSFIGIVGTKDFNSTEMHKYEMVDLAGYNLRHTLIHFDGKHAWPPIDILEEAVWWMELNEMRKTKEYKNDSLIQLHLKPILLKINDLKAHNKSFELYQLCIKTINFYSTLVDLTDCISTWKSLKSNTEVDQALKKEEGIWKKEEDLKQFYMLALQKEEYKWWKKEIANLNLKIQTKSPNDESLMYARVLEYLSLVCYMQASSALKQNNIQAADFFSKIYILVDPTNKEAIAIAATLDSLKSTP